MSGLSELDNENENDEELIRASLINAERLFSTEDQRASKTLTGSNHTTGFEYLYKTFPYETIRDRFVYLFQESKLIINSIGLEGKVRVDTTVLGYVVYRYFSDIARIKAEHNIMYANRDKILAYTTYWYVKEKPLQLVSDDIPDKYLHINEIVAANLLLAKLLNYLWILEKSENADDLLTEFFDVFYYNLKYRQNTPESLELMITAFRTGYNLGKRLQ